MNIPKFVWLILILVVGMSFGWLYKVSFLTSIVFSLLPGAIVVYWEDISKKVWKKVVKHRDLSTIAFNYLKNWWCNEMGTGDKLVGYRDAIVKDGYFEGELVYGFNVPSAKFGWRVIAVVGTNPLKIKHYNTVDIGSYENPLEAYTKVPATPTEITSEEQRKMIRKQIEEAMKEREEGG